MSAKRARQAREKAEATVAKAEQAIIATWGDYEPSDTNAYFREAEAIRLVFQARHLELANGHYPAAEESANKAIAKLGGD